MKNEPNLKDWAETLIHGITINNYLDRSQTLVWLEAELNDIADRYYQLGFDDGDKNGWWKEQDKSLDNIYLKVVENLKKEFPNSFYKRICDDE